MACNTPVTSVQQSLSDFINRYSAAYVSAHQTNPRTPYDEDWSSDCEIGNPDDQNQIEWHKVTQVETSIEGCERALETPIHPDVKAFYTSFWFPPLRARSKDGELELLGIWNPQDLDNLQANFLGNALQQKRRRLPLTFFFAVTLPESEYCLAIDNGSGAVILERAGQAAERTIAQSLGVFLDQIDPVVVPT
ncbi:MAG: SecY-interacting protein Syd [Pseudomonadota bacterium]